MFSFARFRLFPGVFRQYCGSWPGKDHLRGLHFSSQDEPELFPGFPSAPQTPNPGAPQDPRDRKRLVDQLKDEGRRHLGRWILVRLKFPWNRRQLRGWYLCLISAALLVLSFPRAHFAFLAWAAFVPLLTALDGKGPGRAFLLSYVTGILFFAGTLYWFIHVTLPGAVLIVLYLAVYFGLFGWGYSMFCSAADQPASAPIKSPAQERGDDDRMSIFRRNKGNPSGSVLNKIIFIPALWTALEYLRAHLLTGFGWVSLGHSQAGFPGIIQIADVTGVYGISFLVMMVNVFLKETLDVRRNKEFPGRGPELNVSMLVVLAVLIADGIYGTVQLRQKFLPPTIKVGVIQGNIPQELKWDRQFNTKILERHYALTRVAAQERPDLIIWPETAFPAYLWEAPELFEELKKFIASVRIPVLLGLVVKDGEDYFNSAMLFSAQGEVLQRYDKLHLVPFGEYIPLRTALPFLEAIVPIGDFTAGQKFTLMPASTPIGDRDRVPIHFFNVLICFEDTVPELSRGFARAGSNLFVNITNDAWFQDTSAPFLHQQAAVFRSVENRRGLVRAANTGVSCFIDPNGRVTRTVHNQRGRKTYTAGYAVAEVHLNSATTFYTKFGDIFTYLCFGVILGTFLRWLINRVIAAKRTDIRY